MWSAIYVEVRFATTQRHIYTTVCSPIAFTFSILDLYRQSRTAACLFIDTVMCSILIFTLLPLLCSALMLLLPSNAVASRSNASNSFVLRAFQPGSPIHLARLNANDGHFWLGKQTSSSCRPKVEPKCSKGKDTALVVPGNGYANLVRLRNLLPALLLSAHSCQTKTGRRCPHRPDHLRCQGRRTFLYRSTRRPNYRARLSRQVLLQQNNRR